MESKILIENSADILKELHLKLELTAALACFTKDRKQGVVLWSIGGGKMFSFTPKIGYEFPLYASGPGKALLAALPVEERAQLIESLELISLSPTTVTDKAELLNQLSSARSQGYCVDNGEIVVGINCVSAPLIDSDNKVVAAIWVTAPIVDLPIESFKIVGEHVQRAALEIQERLFGKTPSHKNYMNVVIDKAIKQMETDLAKHLNVEALAESLNVRYDWFRKKFKQLTGESPNQYHTRLRIGKAQNLLSHTTMSVKEISILLGYDSQDYFSAFFKKKSGISPLHYREQS